MTFKVMSGKLGVAGVLVLTAPQNMWQSATKETLRDATLLLRGNPLFFL